MTEPAKRPMRLMEIVEALNPTKEKFNTNNAWGFGGEVRTKYTFSDGAVIRKGKRIYRHRKSTSFVIMITPDNKVIYNKKLIALRISEMYNAIH